MKFLLANILFLFSVILVNAQGGKTYDDLRATKTLVQPFFVDTAAANAGGAKKAYNSIITTNGGFRYWTRNETNTRWVDLAASFRMDTTIFIPENNMVIRQEGNRVYFSALSGGNGESGSGFNGIPVLTYSGTGFVFDFVGPDYYIKGKHYEGFSAQVTLDPSDPSLGRDDKIVVDTLRHLVALKGTPAASHFPPGLDGLSQLEATSIFVGAGTTQPSEINTTLFYDEGTESDTSSSYTPTNTSRFRYNGPGTQPFSGTYCIFTGPFSAGSLNFVKPFTVSASDKSALTFLVKLANINDKFTNFGLALSLFNGSSYVGNTVTIYPYPAANNFGLKNDTTWQRVSIPMSYFGTAFVYDKLRIFSSRPNASGFYVDKIEFQGGINPVTTQKAFTSFQTDDGKLIYALNDNSKGFITGGNDIETSVVNGKIQIDYTGTGGGGGDFIPLAGTESGSPVAGPIEIDNNNYFTLGTISGSDAQRAEIYIDGVSEIGVVHKDADGTHVSIVAGSHDISIVNTDPISKGLQGSIDYSANYDDLSYVQKRYVDDLFATGGGGGLLFGDTDNEADGNRTFETHGNQFYINSNAASGGSIQLIVNNDVAEGMSTGAASQVVLQPSYVNLLAQTPLNETDYENASIDLVEGNAAISWSKTHNPEGGGSEVLNASYIQLGVEGVSLYTSDGFYLKDHFGDAYTKATATLTGKRVLVQDETTQLVEQYTGTLDGGGGSSLPADATGFLYNDGAGSLSWLAGTDNPTRFGLEDNAPDEDRSADITTHQFNVYGSLSSLHLGTDQSGIQQVDETTGGSTWLQLYGNQASLIYVPATGSGYTSNFNLAESITMYATTGDMSLGALNVDIDATSNFEIHSDDMSLYSGEFNLYASNITMTPTGNFEVTAGAGDVVDYGGFSINGDHTEAFWAEDGTHLASLLLGENQMELRMNNEGRQDNFLKIIRGYGEFTVTDDAEEYQSSVLLSSSGFQIYANTMTDGHWTGITGGFDGGGDPSIDNGLIFFTALGGGFRFMTYEGQVQYSLEPTNVSLSAIMMLEGNGQMKTYTGGFTGSHNGGTYENGLLISVP